MAKDSLTYSQQLQLQRLFSNSVQYLQAQKAMVTEVVQVN